MYVFAAQAEINHQYLLDAARRQAEHRHTAPSTEQLPIKYVS